MSLIRQVPSVLGTLVLAALLLAPARPLRAGDVPASAYAQSMGVPGLLLDYPGLVFRMPETAPCFPPQLLALVPSDASTAGLGAIFRIKGSSLFLFSQPMALRTTYVDYGSVVPVSTSSAANLQVGWATDRLPARLGLSARGFMRQSSSASFTQRWGSYVEATDNLGEDREHGVEAALGLGLGKRSALLDALVEVRWHNIDDDAAAGSQRENAATGDTSFVMFHQEQKPAVSVLLRSQIPVAGQGLLTAVGQWGQRRHDWRGILISMTSEAFVDSTSSVREFQDSWLAGLALSMPMAALDRLIVSASYTSARTPLFDVRNSTDIRRIRLSQRSGALALSVEQSLFTHLDLQAGLRASYDFQRTDLTEFWPDSHLNVGTARSEVISNRFSWGLTYAWKRFRLAGSLRTNLELSAPFLALDVRYLL